MRWEVLRSQESGESMSREHQCQDRHGSSTASFVSLAQDQNMSSVWRRNLSHEVTVRPSDYLYAINNQPPSIIQPHDPPSFHHSISLLIQPFAHTYPQPQPISPQLSLAALHYLSRSLDIPTPTTSRNLEQDLSYRDSRRISMSL
jgi:hypothetical protein